MDTLFKSEGMKNSTPRMQMLDGFNEGWIDFEGGKSNSVKGKGKCRTMKWDSASVFSGLSFCW
jgi:hypothetical protein